MNKANIKNSQLLQLFKQEKCQTMEDICQLLNHSGRSTQRLLNKIGYYSSFTHNGKWYTLQSIPEFDENGLWFYRDIGFSKRRNLTATILYLIENSVKGLTAGELIKILSKSCPPVLNRIYKANKINRVKTSHGFAYISLDSAIRDRQLGNLDQADVIPSLSDADTIIILVEFIRNPNQTVKELVLRLKQKRGSFCGVDTIKNLFVRLGLEKKLPKKLRQSW